MSYTVEIRRIGDNHSEWMAELQSWLDHHQIKPLSFEHSSGGPGIAFRLEFSNEDHATAFAAAFRGRFEYGDDPHGAGLWPISP